ncbi:hypothetical protein OSTOST_25251, partial [Ostertagia ostertagi]
MKLRYQPILPLQCRSSLISLSAILDYIVFGPRTAVSCGFKSFDCSAASARHLPHDYWHFAQHELSAPPVIFKSEWWFTIAGSVMAFTCGYFSSLALIYTP